MIKILFMLILLFLAMVAITGIFLGLHRFFFKQEMQEIVEEAAEESIREAIKQKAEEIKQDGL